MLSDKTNTLSLIEKIENECIQQGVQARAKETKAELYLRLHQYDSAIYYANQSITYCSNVPSISLIKAQSFSYKAIKDSAVYYAYQVLSTTSALSDNNNALYIITNNDQSKDTEHIRATASERADIQKLLEIRQGKLSQAVQLLEQDLNRETDWRWLYILVAIVLFAGSISILFYIWHKRKQHYQIITDIQEKEAEIGALSQMQETQHKQIIEEVENKCTALRYAQDLKSQLHWRQYDEMCQIIDTQFFLLVSKLKQIPAIKENDVRICVLVLLNLSQRDIARLMYVEESSVGKLKERTGNKLHTSRKNMRQELLKIIIGDKK